MGKVKIDVCEHCGQASCSGKMYRAFDDRNDRLLPVCEHQTLLMIRSDVYDSACGISMLESRDTGDVITTTAKYIKRAARERGFSFVPVERVFFVSCGNFAIAMPKAYLHPQYERYPHYENLSIPFSQLGKGEIYNNGCATLDKVGQ